MFRYKLIEKAYDKESCLLIIKTKYYYCEKDYIRMYSEISNLLTSILNDSKERYGIENINEVLYARYSKFVFSLNTKCNNKTKLLCDSFVPKIEEILNKYGYAALEKYCISGISKKSIQKFLNNTQMVLHPSICNFEEYILFIPIEKYRKELFDLLMAAKRYERHC